MAEQITCNLAQNALDYLILGGEQAQDGSPRMLKHSVATLADGTELLLKACLEAHSWRLLFDGEQDADERRYHSGDFKSVGLNEAILRLRKICNVLVQDEHVKTLVAIRKLRNRIRHFALTANRQEVLSLITKTYSFAIDFTTHHLESACANMLGQELNILRKLLGGLDEFVEGRLKEIRPILDSQDYTWHLECPKCGQTTLYPSEGHAKCAFCGYGRDGEEAAEDVVDYSHNLFSPKRQSMPL